MGVPRRALIAQDQKMPRAAVSEAFLVSSATCPLASKPVRTPEVKRNDRVQFQPVGAPVPLYVSRKKEASWKPASSPPSGAPKSSLPPWLPK